MNKFLKASLYAIITILLQSGIFFITRALALDATLLSSLFDDTTPFIPEYIYFYFVWYIFLFLIPFILYFKDKELLKEYLVTAIVCDLFLLVTYVVYPTTIARAEFNVTGISTWLVDFIYNADLPVRNCFPSAHCLYSFMFVFFIYRLNNIKPIFKYIIIFLSLMVLPTVLFIKQHVVADVIGAAVYFIVCVIIAKLFLKMKWLKPIEIK